MANRRMFSLDVIDTDRFLDMPATAQLLYFHLGMRADDDGFISSPKQIMRMISSTQGDMKVLIEHGYVIPFESGIVVIRHWKQHNYIQSDRYKRTKYVDERKQLQLIDNVYTVDTECIQLINNADTQDRLGKDRLELGKDNIKESKSKRFTPPTLEEVQEYCKDNEYSVDAEAFIDFYTSKGWMVGKNKMKEWKAAIRTWEKRNRAAGQAGVAPVQPEEKPIHYETQADYFPPGYEFVTHPDDPFQ